MWTTVDILGYYSRHWDLFTRGHHSGIITASQNLDQNKNIGTIE